LRHDVDLFDATNPADLRSASPGTSLSVARRDHVHNSPGGGGGALVQSVYAQNNTWDNTGTAIPIDNTIPQNTEGKEAATVTITPTNASNIIEIAAHVNLVAGGNQYLTIALFVGTSANAIAVSYTFQTNGNTAELNILHRVVAGSTSARTYKLRFGANSGTVYINGGAGSALYGGVSYTTLVPKEFTP